MKIQDKKHKYRQCKCNCPISFQGVALDLFVTINYLVVIDSVFTYETRNTPAAL